MDQEILRFIGLINRAGAIITGTDMVLNGARSGKVKLILIDSAVSDKTMKKVKDKCAFYKIPMVVVDESLNLGHAIGKNSRKIIGITDVNFTKLLKEKLNI